MSVKTIIVFVFLALLVFTAISNKGGNNNSKSSSSSAPTPPSDPK